MSSSHAAPIPPTAGKRTKRKGKEPPPQAEEVVQAGTEELQEAEVVHLGEGGDEEEDAGITRCVCDGLGPPSTLLR